jgi:uncharacterized protein (DUF4415 family)
MHVKERNTASRKDVIDEHGEVADLSKLEKSDFSALSTLPTSLQAKLKGRPKAVVTKVRITIRLSPEVVQTFRASGDGWQTRMDAALKDWLKSHKVA